MKVFFQLVVFLNILSTVTVVNLSYVIKNQQYACSVALEDMEDQEGENESNVEYEDGDSYFLLSPFQTHHPVSSFDNEFSNYHIPKFATHWVDQITPPPEV